MSMGSPRDDAYDDDVGYRGVSRVLPRPSSGGHFHLEQWAVCHPPPKRVRSIPVRVDLA